MPAKNILWGFVRPFAPPTHGGSISTYNLRYTEFYGDGDSKSYTNVKYTYEGIEIKKQLFLLTIAIYA